MLDKLASNITKVSDDAAPEELDSPGDKSLEFELNVKTKIKKEESCEDTSGESDDNAAAGDLAASSSPGLGPDTSPRLASTPTKEDAEAVTSPDKLSNNTFFKSLLLKSPKCDRKQEVSRYYTVPYLALTLAPAGGISMCPRPGPAHLPRAALQLRGVRAQVPPAEQDVPPAILQRWTEHC